MVIVFPLQAEENKTYELDYLVEKKFEIGGISKYQFANPDMVEAKIEKGVLYLTGKIEGQTILYVWKSNQVLVYIVNIVLKKNNPVRTAERRRIKINSNIPNGNYSVNNVSGFGNQLFNQEKLILNNFNFNLPFSIDEGLNFRTGFNNRFTPNYSQIQSLSIPNFILSYYSPDKNLDIGDTSYFNPLGNINQINNSIKGIKYSSTNKNNRFDLFTGLEQEQIILYDILPAFVKNTPKKYYISGITGLLNTLVKNLDIFGSAISKIDFGSEKENYFNLASGFNWQPTPRVNLNANIGTNFNGFGFTGGGSYRLDWENTKEFIEAQSTYRFLGNNFLRLGSEQLNAFSFRVNSHHISGINFGGSYGADFTDNRANSKTISFELSKSFSKINLFSIASSYEFSNSINNSFTLGSEFQEINPITIKYNLFQSIYGSDTGYINQLQGTVKLLDFYNINLYYSSDLSLLGRSNNSQFRLNNTLSTNLNLNRDLSLNLSLNINNIYPDIRNNVRADNFVVSLNTKWNINLFNNISVNLNYNSGFGKTFTNQSLNTLVGYTYNFGVEFDEFFGDIKGIVFDDVNDNSVYDPDEKIMPGIKVYVKDKVALTTSQGYRLTEIDYGIQEVKIDPAQLPEGYRVTTESPVLVNLNSKENQANFGIRNKKIVRGILFGNKNRTTGLENVELILDGDNKTLTDSGGAYTFSTGSGNHNIRINPLTIPPGFILSDKLVKEFEIRKEDQEIYFTFSPIISIKGLVFYSDTGKTAANIILNIKYIFDESETKETVITDQHGNFSLKNLGGEKIEISSPLLKEPIEVEILPEPGEIYIKVPLP